MKMKNFITFAVSAALAIPVMNVLTAGAEDVQIGNAYIRNADSSSENIAITTDGKYDLTFEVKDDEVLTDSSIRLNIDADTHYPLGVKGEVELTIDELWVDDTQIDVGTAGKPTYAFRTDMYYVWGEDYRNYVSGIDCLLIDINADADITEVRDNVRVVFSLSNLTDPETFEPNIPAAVTTTTASDETETTTTTATAIKTTSTAKKTSSAADPNLPPKTGDKGIVGLGAVLISAAGITFIAKKRHSDK